MAAWLSFTPPYSRASIGWRICCGSISPCPKKTSSFFWNTLSWVLALKLAIFYLSGDFHGWWRYVTFADLAALVRAAFFSLCALVIVIYFFQHSELDPSAVDFALGFSPHDSHSRLACGRVGGLFSEQFMPIFDREPQPPALLVGVDHNSALLAHQIQAHTQLHYRIQGLYRHLGRSRITARGWGAFPSSADWKTSAPSSPPPAPPISW